MELRAFFAAYEFWGGVFCLTSFFCLVVSGWRRRDERSRYVAWMELTAAALFISDSAAWFFRGIPGAAFHIVLMISNFLADLTSFWLPAIFCLYVFTYFDEERAVFCRKNLWPAAVALCGFNTVILVVSQFSGLLYYIDDDNIYRRGSFFGFVSALAMLIFLMLIVMVIRERKRLSTRHFAALLMLVIIPPAAVGVQTAFYGYPVINTAVALEAIGLIYHELVVQAGIINSQMNTIEEKDDAIENMQTRIALSQIKPHFLYNSLNSIYVLCGRDLNQGRKAISDLADYLRANIGSIDSRYPIPFTK